jgi:polyhydroxybutyrate depolymerase
MIRPCIPLACAGLLLLSTACGGSDASSAASVDSGPPARASDAGTVQVSMDAAAREDASPTPVADSGAPRMTPDASSSPCSGLPSQPKGDTTWTVATPAGNRTAMVHIPPGYDPARLTPLVLNFHGYGGSPVQEEGLTLMDAESDAAGFVLVYPQGTGTLPSWNAGACCGTAAQSNVDDVGFVGSLLDKLEAQLCVDSRRVFATGMSNGGFMSHRLGCELADRIAAIAPVAGVMGIPTCNPSRPVPVMEFHGTSDPIVPYDGNASISYPSVATTISGWVQRDGCQGTATTTYSKGDATCVTYDPCAGGAEVTLCTIAGGGHTWPGGTPFPLLGATSMDISATDAMWTFFQKHAM